jgi:hypothetical protein
MTDRDETIIKNSSVQLDSYGDRVVVTLELGATATIQLIGLLQLVTRHPELPERQREFAKGMVGNLSQGFRKEHRAIAELIKRGWAAEHDKVVEE